MLKVVLLIIPLIALTIGFIPCEDPSRYVGSWVSSQYAKQHGLGKECVALVQNNCRNVGLTSKWRRGVYVKENCGRIPKLTAIATFLGPNHRYDEPHLHQHTAIFVKCEANGIRVWDQWNAKPLASRVIPWRGSSSQYTGDNFWTING